MGIVLKQLLYISLCHELKFYRNLVGVDSIIMIICIRHNTHIRTPLYLMLFAYGRLWCQVFFFMLYNIQMNQQKANLCWPRVVIVPGTANCENKFTTICEFGVDVTHFIQRKSLWPTNNYLFYLIWWNVAIAHVSPTKAKYWTHFTNASNLNIHSFDLITYKHTHTNDQNCY